MARAAIDETPESPHDVSRSNPVPVKSTASDLQAGVMPPVENANPSTVPMSESLPVTSEQPENDAYTFTPRGVFCGLVTDVKTGAPVSGACIQIPALPHVYESVTDKHGFYSIDKVHLGDGNYTIKIISKDYLGFGHGESYAVVRVLADECTVKHYPLERGCRIEVKVIDEQKMPVDNASLMASWLGPDFKRRDLGKDQTDPNGQATIGAIKASEIPYQLNVRHPDYVLSGTTIVLDDPNRVKHVTLVLKKGVSIEGYVEYADGVPAKEVTIHAVPNPNGWLSNKLLQASPVDENGDFVLPQIGAGLYSINASVPTGDQRGGSIVYSVMERTLPLPDGELLTLKLRENAPLPQMRQGQQTNRISRHEARMTAPIATAPEERPIIQGDVIAIDTRKPVKDFKIRLRKIESLDGNRNVPKDAWMSCKNGYYEVKTVGPGIYQIQVEADGYGGTLSQEINTNDETYASIRLGKGGTIRGHVIGGDGSPVANAGVIPLSAACGNWPGGLDKYVSERGAVETQGDGSFIMPNIPIGVETLKVIHAHHVSRIVEGITVKEGEVTEDVKVQLSQGGRVEGVVYDDQGYAQPNVILNFQDSRHGGPSTDPSGHLKMVVTDANGYYAVTGLPANKVCSVSRYQQNTSVRPKQAFIPFEGHATQLDFGGREVRVEGTVVVHGVPLPNTKVVLTGPGQRTFNSQSYVTMADAQGQFVFRGVLPGRYTVNYQKESGGDRWQKAAVCNLGDDPVSLGDIPVHLAALEVYVTGSNTDATQWDVYYQEGLQLATMRVGDATMPSQPGDPYIIRGLLPGMGRISVRPVSGTGPTLRKTLDIYESTEPIKVNVVIPQGSASVSGKIWTESGQPRVLFNTDFRRAFCTNILSFSTDG